MALIALDTLNSLQILNLMDHPGAVEELIRAHRVMEGRPFDAQEYPDEFMWKSLLAVRAMNVVQVLGESDPFELNDLWAKHTGEKKPRGKPQWTSALYDLAARYKKTTGKTLMEVYRDMVLPMLIVSDKVATDQAGEPNQEQEEKARKAYLNAMASPKRRT